MSPPLLSIVVPNYNAGRYSQECLASLVSEKNDLVEYIFVDGGSSDSSLRVFENRKDLFSNFITEPDRGQSDAFNKGFRLARGKFLTWLNSDDKLFPGSINKLIGFLQKSSYNWVACNTVYIDSNSNVTRCCRSGQYEKFAIQNGMLNVFGPSTIFRRSVFERVGPFNENFHYCMDTEYWWRLVRMGYRYHRYPLYFWQLRLHEDAKTASVLLNGSVPDKMQLERSRIQTQFFPKISERKRRIALLVVRTIRILNGSYIRSFFDTKRFSGKPLI